MSDENPKAGWSSELPKAWAWADFSDVVLNCTDSARKLAKKQYLPEGRFPVIDQGEEFASGYSNDESLVSTVTLPCIVWGDHTRRSKFVDEPFVQGADGVKVLGPSGAVFPEFIFRQLNYVELPDKGYSRHFKFLKEKEFPLPPLPEQRRIVKKLDQLSARTTTARTHLTAIAKLVERYRTQVLQAALSGVYTADWRLTNPDPATTAAVIINECNVNCISVRRSKQPTRNLVEPSTIPSHWGFERGEDICSVIVDGTHHTPTYVEAGVPFISVKDVRNGQVYFDACRYIPEEEHAELSKRCAPKAGDVLITKSGTIGRLAVLKDVPAFSLFVSVAMIRPASLKLDPTFLAFALENWIRSINIGAEITGSTIKNLHLQDIKALGVPIPPLEEQSEIVRRIEAAFAKIDRLAAEAEKALKLTDRLDQRILTKAFAGELVPQDPTDEPATELLARIKAARANAPKTRTKALK